MEKFNFKKKFKNEDYLRMAMLIYVDWLNGCYYFSQLCGINETIVNNEQNEPVLTNINNNVLASNNFNSNLRTSRNINNSTLKSNNQIIREN